jgi:hypothetical protein
MAVWVFFFTFAALNNINHEKFMKTLIMTAALLLSTTLLSAQSGLSKGYRGFFDVALGGDEGGTTFDLTTIHGGQINPHLFLGAGITVHFGCDELSLPIFANLRYDILDKRNTPYADLKLGGVTFDGEGFYLSPTIGYRFRTTRRAVNLGVSYVMRTGGPWETHDWEMIADRNLLHGCCVRLGFEW